MKLQLIIAFAGMLMMNDSFASDPFKEGVETQLTREQIAEIIPWAQNTKTALERLLKKTENMNFLALNQTLEQGIRREVIQSAPRYSELKMRYALNRGLKVNSVLRTSRYGGSYHAVEAANLVLVKSIQLAVSNYQSDINFLENAKKGIAASPMNMEFAVDSLRLLGSVLPNVFGPQESYVIQRLRVSFLQNDLYRLERNKELGQTIMELEELLKDFPETAPTSGVNAQKMFLRLYSQSEKVYSTFDSSSVSNVVENNRGPHIFRWELQHCLEYNQSGRYLGIAADESLCPAK